MNTATATKTYTAASAYGTVHQGVTIDAKGIVFAANGALLGDVEGMERFGWEFTA